MTAWVVPNGLAVTRRDGSRERFVVGGRRSWAEAITGAVSGAAQPA